MARLLAPGVIIAVGKPLGPAAVGQCEILVLGVAVGGRADDVLIAR